MRRAVGPKARAVGPRHVRLTQTCAVGPRRMPLASYAGFLPPSTALRVEDDGEEQASAKEFDLVGAEGFDGDVVGMGTGG